MKQLFLSLSFLLAAQAGRASADLCPALVLKSLSSSQVGHSIDWTKNNKLTLILRNDRNFADGALSKYWNKRIRAAFKTLEITPEEESTFLDALVANYQARRYDTYSTKEPVEQIRAIILSLAQKQPSSLFEKFTNRHERTYTDADRKNTLQLLRDQLAEYKSVDDLRPQIEAAYIEHLKWLVEEKIDKGQYLSANFMGVPWVNMNAMELSYDRDNSAFTIVPPSSELTIQPTTYLFEKDPNSSDYKGDRHLQNAVGAYMHAQKYAVRARELTFTYEELANRIANLQRNLDRGFLSERERTSRKEEIEFLKTRVKGMTESEKVEALGLIDLELSQKAKPLRDLLVAMQSPAYVRTLQVHSGGRSEFTLDTWDNVDVVKIWIKDEFVMRGVVKKGLLKQFEIAKRILDRQI